MYETSTGPPETFIQKVGLRHEAAGSGKEAGVKDRPSLESKTVGVPGHEIIALLLIFMLFVSTRWGGGLIALIIMALTLGV
jgi:hypothetical protein